MTLQVAVGGVQRIGAVPHGTRVTVPIAGGHFEGPRLRGKVLPGGGDWTLLRGDGVLELAVRLTLETDDGALIHMTSFGLRHGQPKHRRLCRLCRGSANLWRGGGGETMVRRLWDHTSAAQGDGDLLVGQPRARRQV